MCTRRLQTGFTLVELIITLVILSVAAAAIAAIVATTARGSADPVIQTQALYVAEGYLEEALLKAYDNPDGVIGPCASSRDLWDSVQDYSCLNAASTPTDQQGNAVPALSAYRVSMTVGTPAVLGGANTRELQVRVRRNDGSVDLTLTAQRAEY